MGNTFFDSALNKVKVDCNAIVKQTEDQKKEDKICVYYITKEERQCGNIFKSRGITNRYCSQCNRKINKINEKNYLKYSKNKSIGGKHGKSEWYSYKGGSRQNSYRGQLIESGSTINLGYLR